MLYTTLIIQLIFTVYCVYVLREKDSPAPGFDRSLSDPASREKIALNMILFFALSFVLRAYFLLTQTNGDVKYYVGAAASLLDDGFFGYYNATKIVYPPLFNYLYCLIGWLIRLIGLPLTDMAQLPLFLLKLPATICDYLTAFLLYRAGAKRGVRFGFGICCLYIMNPAVIFNSAYVGQVDSIYSLFVLLTLCCVAKRRSDIGCFFFVIAFLFKYQTVFVFPVLLFGLLREVFFEDFRWKKFWRYLLLGCLSLVLIFIAYLPFIYDPATGTFAPELMFGTVNASIEGYARCSTNAYNFWTLLGYNMKSVENPYLFFTVGTWGTIHIVLLVCGSCLLFWRKRKSPEACPLLGAFLVAGVFCFSVKMMCRYFFPALALLYMAYAMHPTGRLRRCVGFFSILYVPVIMLPLTCYGYTDYHDGLILPRILSAGMVAAFAYLTYAIWKKDEDTQK